MRPLKGEILDSCKLMIQSNLQFRISISFYNWRKYLCVDYLSSDHPSNKSVFLPFFLRMVGQ